LEFDRLLLFLNFDYELQLWCSQQFGFHGVAQNQTFIIVGPYFFWSSLSILLNNKPHPTPRFFKFQLFI
jgi:hypothetical protein